LRLVEAVSPYLNPVAVVAMRYWHPFTAEAVDTLRKSGPLDESVLLLTLPALFLRYYVEQLEGMAPDGRSSKVGTICGGPAGTHDQQFSRPSAVYPGAGSTDWIRIAAIPGQFAHSFGVSAHGLPMSLVEKGDPYPKQIEETVRLACELGAKQYPGWPRTHLLCYQSRVAREVAATAAYRHDRAAGHEGVKEMLVVPISFVTEHIGNAPRNQHRAREEAKKLGVETFRMMPAVGDSPLFIAALKELVLHAVGVDAGERPGRAAFPR